MMNCNHSIKIEQAVHNNNKYEINPYPILLVLLYPYSIFKIDFY